VAVRDPLRPFVHRGQLAMAREPQEPGHDGGDALSQTLGYGFARPQLLREALSHPSIVSGERHHRGRRPAAGRSYERLEFLGDRVLGLVIAELLWRRFPDEPEGDLTRRHTHLVRRESLAQVAAAIGLGQHLTFSPAEAAAGGADNPAILADACEAVIAAIYVDGGFEAAAAFVHRCWAPLIEAMTTPPRDPKTALQEWAQGRGLPLPAYELVATSGPDHAPVFTVSVNVAGREPAVASASSKRHAEAKAAAVLLDRVAAP
jgi:ribonuclease-3